MQPSSNSDEAASQRLRTALDLFEFGLDMMRQKLRRQDPDATEEQIQERLVAWLQERPGAEHGDAVGRVVSWPRRPR